MEKLPRCLAGELPVVIGVAEGVHRPHHGKQQNGQDTGLEEDAAKELENGYQVIVTKAGDDLADV